MADPASQSYVSRGGEKLAAALDHFGIDVSGLVCADLGSHVGGFVDCLLQRGAAKVYSVDTCYGTLAWKLRRDPRVVVLERSNAMHVSLPEPVDLVTVDVGWTRQAKVLPNVVNLLRPGGNVLTLIKPQYEAALAFPLTKGGKTGVEPDTKPDQGNVRRADRRTDTVLSDEVAQQVVDQVVCQMTDMGWTVVGTTTSPIRGQGGNMETFGQLVRTAG